MNPGQNEVFGSAANVRILDRHPRRRPERGEYVGVIDDELRVDPSMLQKYCFASPTIEAVDFVTVLAAIRFADRAVKRRHSIAWARKIELSIPVSDVKLWSASRVSEQLQQCLNYLTGDLWQFEFVKRGRVSKPLGSGHTSHVVKLPEAAYVGIPYSDGLDSYAQAKLLMDREPGVRLICTFTDYKGGPQSWQRFCKTRQQELTNIYSIPVPFQVDEPHHAESSFRSRPFIFYSLAAYAASLARSKRVLIPENGQGSIGGSLVLLGNEAPHRSCYPGFLMRLNDLLRKVLGTDMVFEHPGLLQTKGQVLKALAEVEDVLYWGHKRSCSHDQRHSTIEGRRVHCGVCGGCLLRRMSMLSGGITDPTSYLFHKLDVRAVDAAAQTNAPVRAMNAMRDVARNSVRDMQRLADLVLTNDSRLEEVALDIADAHGMLAADALERVRTLLRTHRDEWLGFLEFCGQHSWIRGFVND